MSVETQVTTDAQEMCPTCREPMVAAFCARCGERRPSARDLSIRGLLEQAIDALAPADGRVFRTFQYLIARPGFLTAAYLSGSRKPYIAPLQLFLVTNVLFFATQSLTGWRVFSTPLQSHLTDQIYSPLAQRMTDAHLQARFISREAYASVFDHAVEVNAKSLIILMIVPLAIVALLLFGNSRRPMVSHAVFALHFLAFMLVLYSVTLPLVSAVMRLVAPDSFDPQVDIVVTLMQLALCAIYLTMAVPVVYRTTGLTRIAKVTLLVLALPFVILGYRFAIFVITLYST